MHLGNLHLAAYTFLATKATVSLQIQKSQYGNIFCIGTSQNNKVVSRKLLNYWNLFSSWTNTGLLIIRVSSFFSKQNKRQDVFKKPLRAASPSQTEMRSTENNVVCCQSSVQYRLCVSAYAPQRPTPDALTDLVVLNPSFHHPLPSMSLQARPLAVFHK